MVTIAVRWAKGSGAASGDVVCPLWCRARSLGVLCVYCDLGRVCVCSVWAFNVEEFVAQAKIMSDDYHPSMFWIFRSWLRLLRVDG